MDVMKDEAEVANREQDLTIAKTTLQFQELLIKNALTKNLDDPDSGGDARAADRLKFDDERSERRVDGGQHRRGLAGPD